MRLTFFVHSLVSDWNHGNAHFFRGVFRALQALGHKVRVWEPVDGWSRRNLLAQTGEDPEVDFARRFPGLTSRTYDDQIDLDEATAESDVVIVHEWNEPWLTRRLGRMRARGAPFVLLFHDTHHRAVSEPNAFAPALLDGFDGALVFGRSLQEVYLKRGLAHRAWVWHEAADMRVFRPQPDVCPEGDLVWIGNWGDEERSQELKDYLFEPARAIGAEIDVWGVRYPDNAQAYLRSRGARHHGWLANADAPAVFAQHKLTVHVPRGHYARDLPGIPTIRVFEALACGIPLLSAPWNDVEGLFEPGNDFILAPTPAAMTRSMAALMRDADQREHLARHGLRTIAERHTCDHRAAELISLCENLIGGRMESAA